MEPTPNLLSTPLLMAAAGITVDDNVPKIPWPVLPPNPLDVCGTTIEGVLAVQPGAIANRWAKSDPSPWHYKIQGRVTLDRYVRTAIAIGGRERLAR